MLEIKNLSVSVQNKAIINSLNLKIEKGKKQNFTDQSNMEDNKATFITKFKLLKPNYFKYAGHYSRAIDIFKNNYFLGSGFKSYRKICGQYETMRQPNQYDTDENRRLSCSIHPHNYHLEILSDTGIIGYLIFSGTPQLSVLPFNIKKFVFFNSSINSFCFLFEPME